MTRPRPPALELCSLPVARSNSFVFTSVFNPCSLPCSLFAQQPFVITTEKKNANRPQLVCAEEFARPLGCFIWYLLRCLKIPLFLVSLFPAALLTHAVCVAQLIQIQCRRCSPAFFLLLTGVVLSIRHRVHLYHLFQQGSPVHLPVSPAQLDDFGPNNLFPHISRGDEANAHYYLRRFRMVEGAQSAALGRLLCWHGPDGFERFKLPECSHV
jgi:hypothetical protein